MALRSLTVVLLAIAIIPDKVVMANVIAKPRQMIVNISYDLVEDGNATHPDNPTAVPTVTVPPETTVTLKPVTPTQGTASVTVPAGLSTTNDGEFHCPSAGTFADPKDCKKFYRCTDALVPRHDSCFFGHYDSDTKGCKFGDC